MDYLASQPQFNNLSITELLIARDQFHAHLMHKANVVGTAIGRYLIRKTDPYPDPQKTNAIKEKAVPQSPKPPRTLENSEVRNYSWPCVLVFVSKWEDASKFDDQNTNIGDFIPKTIYMEDGRSVPVCIVFAPMDENMPPPIDPSNLEFPEDYLSGGYPVSVEVQKQEHTASLGCLVTDGHRMYALTSRHVVGEANTKLYTYLNKKKHDIGISSNKSLGQLPFESLYKTWSGKNIYVNMDVGLIDITNINEWQPTIFGLGEIGPLADLSIYNLTLNIIGCPVQASGCVGGHMFGQISALFYRYKSIGGFEYVSDFLIGSRSNVPLKTHPGDSGTVWVMESDDVKLGLQPIAVQWGGTVFSESTNLYPFALATNLSNICRELKVDLFRSSRLAAFDYWGAVGHYTIGSYACEVIADTKLKKLMKLNQLRVSFATDNITTKVNAIKPPGFIQLADVPDKVWKKVKGVKTPYGRKGPENPNHYADIDYGSDTVNEPGIPVQSLDARTPDVLSLTTQNWKDYYDQLQWQTDSQRGCLPFRVWQIYKDMVQFVQNGDLDKFVTAAGIIAHYIGDGSQPLHCSYLDDGDPWRDQDENGTASATMHKHSQGYGAGVHEAYETAMLNSKISQLKSGLNNLIGTSHQMQLINGGQEAGFATLELMRRTKAAIHPMNIVLAYANIMNTGQSQQTSALLWQQFGPQTIDVIKDGCKTLAMIWDSAWQQGGGHQLDDSSFIEFAPETLENIYEDQNFLPSVILDDIDQYL